MGKDSFIGCPRDQVFLQNGKTDLSCFFSMLEFFFSFTFSPTNIQAVIDQSMTPLKLIKPVITVLQLKIDTNKIWSLTS